MTRSDPPIQSWSLRSLPALTWAMVLLAIIFIMTTLESGNRSIPSILAGVAPFFFAAAVTYIRPSDQRYLYAALAIAVGRGLSVMAGLIVTQGVVRGELAGTLFDVVAFIDTPIFLAGVVLLGVAIGGVRSRLGIGIVGIGIAIAAVNLVWYLGYLGTLEEPLPVDAVALSLVVAPLFPISWAFVIAAAFEQRKRFLLLGAVGLLAQQVVLVLASIANLGPETDFNAVGLVFDVVGAFGWLLLAVAPLRLEMGTQRPLRELAPA